MEKVQFIIILLDIRITSSGPSRMFFPQGLERQVFIIEKLFNKKSESVFFAWAPQ